MADHDTHDHTGIPGVGGGIAATIVDAKGDLIVGTAADTVARLAVGANDTIPMADSGQSTGIKWVASQTPSTQAFSDAAAEGTADTYARGDHKHGMMASPGGGGISSGTSNPGSPSDGDLFYRSDLDLLIRYRSTGTRWVTTTLYRETMGIGDNLQPFSAGGGQAAARWGPWFTTWDLWLETLYTSTFVATTNNGSNYWTAALVKYTAAAAATTIVSPNTSADTASNFVTKATAIGAALGTTNKHLTLELTKTAGAPGNIYCSAAIAYRLIVT